MAKKKILLVDDERDLVSVVTEGLEENGYEVLAAYDGEEALVKAKRENPDLIILDLMLPKMDGYKVCGLLKRDTRYHKIPILMFSARVEEEAQRIGKEVGADFYLTKPFEPGVLLGKIHELIEK